MADIDLYQEAYRTHLGRDASPEELQGWTSGQFGGGTVQDRLNQIANSHEAQQRKPQPAPVIGQPNPNVSSPIVPSSPTPPPSQQVGQPYPGVASPQTGDAEAMARARAGLENTYFQFLGRAPNPGDVDMWLSGGFGHGSGLADYDKFVAAIMNSPEARAYRPPGMATPGAYQNLEWWQQSGVPAIDIFDPLTGQLKPGWVRTARGYERTGPAGGTGTTGGGSTTGGPRSTSFADVQAWFPSLTAGKPPTYESLKALEPLLNQHGIRLASTGSRGWTDSIILPDGTVIDLITNAGAPNAAWAFFIPSPHGSGGVGGGALPPNQYSDPNTALLESLIKARLGMLQQPFNDPYRDQYIAAMQARANALGSALEPEYQRLLARLEQRFNDLQGPGYTGAENEAIRTGALDPIETDRAAARQRMLERLSARGITPDSGIAQMALLEVDKAFDSMRATTQTTLTTNDLARRESRQQRADTVGAALYDIPQGRAREQLDVFSALEMIENVMRQEEEARSREAIGYGGVLADLGPQRLQLAMQAAGLGGSPAAFGNTLMNMASLNQNAALLNQRNSSQWLSALGSAAYYLSRAGI